MQISILFYVHRGDFSWWLRRICLQCRRPGFNLWVGKILWRRKWQPTPVFLPGESPWTEEPGRLQSMGSQRIGHNWATKMHVHRGLLTDEVETQEVVTVGDLRSILTKGSEWWRIKKMKLRGVWVAKGSTFGNIEYMGKHNGRKGYLSTVRFSFCGLVWVLSYALVIKVVLSFWVWERTSSQGKLSF